MVWYLWWHVVEWVGQNKETDEEHDENCVEEEFQLTRVKIDKDGKRGRVALGIGNQNHSVNS